MKVKLRDVATFNPRPNRGQIEPDDLVSFVGMSDVSDTEQRIESEESRPASEVLKGYTYFERGDLLLAKITPCFENGKLAIAEIENELGFGSTEFHVIRADADVLDTRYLYHFLRHPAFLVRGEAKMKGSAGQKRLPMYYLSGLSLPLPSLDDQRHIAGILDRADALGAKRQRAQAMLDDLLRGLYLEIVGPENPDYQGWPKRAVEELAAKRKGAIRSGPFGSALKHSEFVGEGIAVLGIDNAVQNQFAWAERRFITPKKYEGLKRYTVHPGDVIITIMGTTGRSAIVPDDIPTAITTKHLATITLDRTLALPEYLATALHSDPVLLRQVV